MGPRMLTVVLTSALVTWMGHEALAAEPVIAAPPPASVSVTSEPAIDEAQTEQSTPAAKPPTRAWFGWQTLLVDGVSLGTVPLEVGTGSFANTPSASYLLLGSLTTYVLGAPIVHAAHHHWRMGALDLGLRAGAVAVGSLVGAAAGGSPTSCDGRVAGCLGAGGNGLVAGAAIGAALASVVDASFLTWDSRPAETGQAQKLTVTPLAQVSGRGGVAGLMGEF